MKGIAWTKANHPWQFLHAQAYDCKVSKWLFFSFFFSFFSVLFLLIGLLFLFFSFLFSFSAFCFLLSVLLLYFLLFTFYSLLFSLFSFLFSLFSFLFSLFSFSLFSFLFSLFFFYLSFSSLCWLWCIIINYNEWNNISFIFESTILMRRLLLRESWKTWWGKQEVKIEDLVRKLDKLKRMGTLVWSDKDYAASC